MAHSQGFHLPCAWEAGAEHWEASGRTTQRENLGNARSHLQGGVWSQLQVLAANSLQELPKFKVLEAPVPGPAPFPGVGPA